MDLGFFQWSFNILGNPWQTHFACSCRQQGCLVHNLLLIWQLYGAVRSSPETCKPTKRRTIRPGRKRGSPVEKHRHIEKQINPKVGQSERMWFRSCQKKLKLRRRLIRSNAHPPCCLVAQDVLRTFYVPRTAVERDPARSWLDKCGIWMDMIKYVHIVRSKMTTFVGWKLALCGMMLGWVDPELVQKTCLIVKSFI